MNATVMSALTYLAIVLAALTGLMLGVRWLQVRNRVHAETARKIVHVGMGLICLPLPWWFMTAGPVLMLAGVTTVVLLIVRYHRTANRHFGSVLGATGRSSFGEFYFPLGVLAALLLCGADRAAFCCGIGVLTFGDMAGAVVGSRFGRLPYAIAGARKSIEGSVAMMLVSFIWIAGVLGRATDLPAVEIVALALTLAAVATGLEAGSRRGIDNLLLPSVTAVLAMVLRHPELPPAPRHVIESAGAAVSAGFLVVASIAIIRVRRHAVATNL